MVDSLIHSFDIWINAQGVKSKGRVKSIENISLEGVTHLRKLILQLALLGKLVPQNPNDEPATELLKRIDKERENSKKITPLKIADIEKPFVLPKGWEWTRLQNIIQISSGDGLTAANMNSQGNIPVFGGNGINGYHDIENVSEPTLVIGRVGFYCGSIHITPSSAWVTDNAFITTFSKDNIYIGFLSWLLQGTNLKENDSATAQPVISGRKVYPIVIALPPLAEQYRIVAKVDELMELCDKLEKQINNNLKTHQLLVCTLLETLAKSINANEFQATWERILSHFDILFCTDDSIDQLSKTILQLAVMGKLVKQDPRDEPATELIKKIDREKAQLVKIGKIKKQVPLSEIREDEKTFVLPKGWVWKRLNDIIDVRDGTHDSPKEAFGDNTYPLITSQNFEKGGINFDNAKRISETDHLEIAKRSLVERYDILFSMIGGNLGNQVMVNTDIVFSVKNVALFKYYNKNYTSPYFIKKSMEYIALNLQSRAIGGAQPFVSLGYLRNIVIALPPISEQNRIVAKIDELLLLCDSLKEKFAQSQKIKNLLSKTIIEEVSQ